MSTKSTRNSRLRNAKQHLLHNNATTFVNKTFNVIQPRQHIITQEDEGAADFEKAFKFSLTEERGMEFVNRLQDWIKENPTNAVVWNALPSKEARDAWLAHILP
ncbi:hypothetical protein ACSS6W_007417 [Trichoderma asperelloides]